MTANIQSPISNFISSQKMELSETQEQAIKLGKLFVEELGGGKDGDTFSKWMAHYLAEQITKSETTTGDEKNRAQQLCCDTILNIWNHQSSLPDGKRPFERFEPIFRTLGRLDPENQIPFYIPLNEYQASKKANISSIADKKVEAWLDVAIEIDQAARLLLKFALDQAAILAKDRKIKAWLKAANKFDNEITISIRSFFSNDEEDNKIERKKQLKIKIDKLNSLTELTEKLKLSLENELIDLK